MKNLFILKKESIGDFEAFVLANGVHSPLEQREDLELELKNAAIRGRILFDLLLSMGTKNKRYFIANFDGEKLSSLEGSTYIPRQYAEVSANILKEFSDSLDFSLVSNAMSTGFDKSITN